MGGFDVMYDKSFRSDMLGSGWELDAIVVITLFSGASGLGHTMARQG